MTLKLHVTYTVWTDSLCDHHTCSMPGVSQRQLRECWMQRWGQGGQHLTWTSGPCVSLGSRSSAE